MAIDVIYEDNHLIAVNKASGDITQGDKTGDEPLPEKIKRWLAEKYKKEGNVFCGVIHRLDRPTSGLVIFSKTSKALSRMNELFKKQEVQKVDRKSTRLNSSHVRISYAVFCLKKKKKQK